MGWETARIQDCWKGLRAPKDSRVMGHMTAITRQTSSPGHRAGELQAAGVIVCEGSPISQAGRQVRGTHMACTRLCEAAQLRGSSPQSGCGGRDGATELLRKIKRPRK